LIHEESAEDFGVGVGDDLSLQFVGGADQPIEIVALFSDNSFSSNYVVDLATWDASLAARADDAVIARIADGVDSARARAAVETLALEYPQIRVEDQSEFLDRAESELDTVLAIVNVFLLIAIVIALIGIVNTLTLSVFERTREIGLLRAVGMTRSQTEGMIRWEAAIVALFGALVGTALGIGFGVAIASAIPSDIVDNIAVPVPTIIQFIFVAAVAGLLASWFPARRASKMNVLDAIAHSG
jgi:putative ABC transport system permease protein